MGKSHHFLDDHLVWAIVHEMHERTRTRSQLARDLGLKRDQVVHIVNRVTEAGGWRCPLAHAPCRICGQTVLSWRHGYPATIHRWCEPPPRDRGRRNPPGRAGAVPAPDQDITRRLALYAARPRVPGARTWSIHQLLVLADTTRSLPEVAHDLGVPKVHVTTELQRLHHHGIDIQRRVGPKIGKPSNYLGHRRARTLAILADLKDGTLSRREIAERHGADLSWVHKIARRDLTGS